MGYLNCPKCARRLRVPDSALPVELRCPACRHAFRNGASALDEEFPTPKLPPEEDLRAGEEGALGEESPFLGTDAAAGRILSQADEAMLREYGSGSGLLELTREAYAVSAGQTPAAQAPPKQAPPGEAATRAAPASEPPAGGTGVKQADEEGPAGTAEVTSAAPGRTSASDRTPPPAAPDTSREELDRQFQVVGTALTLANKLVLAHKSELARSRRYASLAWALLAAMTLAAATGGGLAVRQAGLTDLERSRTDLERSNSANLSGRLADSADQVADAKAQLAEARAQLAQDKKDLPRLAEELAAARNEHRQAQGDLSAAREALATARENLAEKKGAVEGLIAQLQAAGVQVAALAAETQRLQAELGTARAAQAPLGASPTASSQPASSPGAAAR